MSDNNLSKPPAPPVAPSLLALATSANLPPPPAPPAPPLAPSLTLPSFIPPPAPFLPLQPAVAAELPRQYLDDIPPALLEARNPHSSATLPCAIETLVAAAAASGAPPAPPAPVPIAVGAEAIVADAGSPVVGGTAVATVSMPPPPPPPVSPTLMSLAASGSIPPPPPPPPVAPSPRTTTAPSGSLLAATVAQEVAAPLASAVVKVATRDIIRPIPDEPEKPTDRPVIRPVADSEVEIYEVDDEVSFEPGYCWFEIDVPVLIQPLWSLKTKYATHSWKVPEDKGIIACPGEGCSLCLTTGKRAPHTIFLPAIVVGPGTPVILSYDESTGAAVRKGRSLDSQLRQIAGVRDMNQLVLQLTKSTSTEYKVVIKDVAPQYLAKPDLIERFAKHMAQPVEVALARHLKIRSIAEIRAYPSVRDTLGALGLL